MLDVFLFWEYNLFTFVGIAANQEKLRKVASLEVREAKAVESRQIEGSVVRTRDETAFSGRL